MCPLLSTLPPESILSCAEALWLKLQVRQPARYCQKVWIDVGFAADFEGCQTPLRVDASRSSNWTSWSRPGMLLSSARTRPAAVAKPASERNREEGCVFGRSGRFGSLDGWRDLVPMRLSRPEAA